MNAPVTQKNPAPPGTLQWDLIATSRAGRAALGVVLPLAIGWMLGRIDYGVYMALGALPSGLASFQGETRSRVAAVMVASVGMAASTFVGATTAAAAPWLLVPVIALWGYVTGLSISLGQVVSVGVLQWSIALLIAIGLPASPSDAALRAALVLAGGLLQALLVALTWTVRRGASERAALVASYSALASYASSLAAETVGPPPPTAFPAGAALADPNPLLPRILRLAFLDLLEEAERIRASLAALAAQMPHHPPSDLEKIRGLMAEAAGALNLVIRAIDATRPEREALVRELNARVDRLAIDPDASWRWSGEGLLGQLRAVGQILAEFGVAARPVPRGATEPSPHDEAGLAWALATLRANMTTKTEAGRHALRLAVVTALAEVIVQAFGIYQGRWAVLTIFIVLKPDYSSTFSRGGHRALGTVLGAALGGAAAQLAGAEQGGLVVAAAVSVAGVYAFFEVSYVLFSVLLTAYIVILLALLGLPVIPTAEARIYDTLLGSALALIAYRVWPTWEGATAQVTFATLIEAHQNYTAALLLELAHPGSVPPAELRATQAAARQARNNAEATTARLAGEPQQARLTPDLAPLLMATIARLAHAELALHALALSPEWASSMSNAPAKIATHLDDLRAAVDVAMSRIAAALRALHEGEPIPPLRRVYDALASDPTSPAQLTSLADDLVDAINTLDEIWRTHSAKQTAN